MRRKDREVTSREDLEDILRQADVCRIALFAETAPYIVPLNFGYVWADRLTLYFHGAKEGLKHDLLARNNHAGFEIDIRHELVKADDACGWGMKYRSIIGSGRIIELTDAEGKKRGLDAIMTHYQYPGIPVYPALMLRSIKVFCLEVDELSGKARN